MTQPARAPDPGPDVAPATPSAEEEQGARAARREHSYQALLQLGQDLTVSLDLRETVDLLVFNVMGQLGTGRLALWLLSDDDPPQAVLMSCHGFPRRLVETVGAACGLAPSARAVAGEETGGGDDAPGRMGPAESELSRQNGLVVFEPVRVREEVLGWLALGAKVDGTPYTREELDVLQAILGVVGASLLNGRLYNRVLETNRRLSASNERLYEADRLKSEFLRNVNHELRTPLTVVIGALDCLMLAGVGSGPERSLMQAAQQNAQHLKGLVENLLTFSDAVNTRLPVHLVTADVHDALASFCARRHAGVAASLRELTYVHEEGLPPARFDPMRLSQILDELVDNALKFTPHGSHLALTAGRATADGREWVRLEFSDDGPGIPAGRLESVFHSFEQVDGSTTRAAGGLGMGLAFARQLAERMGARLTVASAVGKGTTFTLLLPTA